MLKIDFSLSTFAGPDLPLCISAKGLDSLFPGYDTEQSDGKAPVRLELRGMQSIAPRSNVVAPNRVLSVGQIELNRTLLLN